MERSAWAEVVWLLRSESLEKMVIEQGVGMAGQWRTGDSAVAGVNDLWRLGDVEDTDLFALSWSGES